MVLNQELVNWEFSAVATRPLLHNYDDPVLPLHFSGFLKWPKLYLQLSKQHKTKNVI